MRQKEAVIKTIWEDGTGDEATVLVQLRTEFPGLGGTLRTSEGVAAAYRIEKGTFPKMGHCMFLKHTIIKKLDDYFYRTGVYEFSHIPRPLGSISKQEEEPHEESYIYEWAFGSEGFSWCLGSGGRDPINLHDWNSFANYFNSAGIAVGHDTTDADDTGHSKNIIHQYQQPMGSDRDEMCCLWKRIDFGPKSILINWETLTGFIRDQREELVEVLREDRYEMLILILKYFTERDKITDQEIGRLEMLVADYRQASLMHYAMGFGPAGKAPMVGPITESLI